MQGLALLESSQGNYGAAQQVFQQGADKCPPHPPLFNAWAAVEVLFLTPRQPYLLVARNFCSHCMYDGASLTAFLPHGMFPHLDRCLCVLCLLANEVSSHDAG